MTDTMLATTVALQVLEAIREKHPALIADNMPSSWGMNRLRKELAIQAVAQQPDATIESGRTDQEIVAQTNDLARSLYAIRGYSVQPGHRFDAATHPHEIEAWEGACAAQIMLTQTDPMDALEGL